MKLKTRCVQMIGFFDIATELVCDLLVCTNALEMHSTRAEVTIQTTRNIVGTKYNLRKRTKLIEINIYTMIARRNSARNVNCRRERTATVNYTTDANTSQHII